MKLDAFTLHLKRLYELILHSRIYYLHSVAQWCCEIYLLINPDKTKLLFLGTRQSLSRLPEDPSVVFSGKTLKPADSAKDLRVFRVLAPI